MGTTYYGIVEAGFILLTILCLSLILWGVYQTFLRKGLGRNRAAFKTLIVAATFVVWLILVSALSLNGYFSDFSVMPPRLLPVLLIPLVSILILTFHPATKSFLAHIPAQWLVHIQVFRVPVEVFLWLLFLDNRLPIQMTFEGRNWDVLTGLTAPVVAYLCFSNGRYNQWLAIVWNIAGFALLVNIVATAVLSMPFPFRVFLNEPANTVVTYFPIVFLPTVLVPIAYAMHFFSLRQLLIHQKTSNATAKASVGIEPPQHTV